MFFWFHEKNFFRSASENIISKNVLFFLVRTKVFFYLLRRFRSFFGPPSSTKTNLMQSQGWFKGVWIFPKQTFLSKINRSGDTKMTKCTFSHKKSNQNRNEIWVKWDRIEFPSVKRLGENCLPFKNPMNFTAWEIKLI